MAKSVWTDDNLVKSPFDDVDIPDLTLDQYVWRNLDAWRQKTAVVCAVSKRAYTYEQVYIKSRALAANLRKKMYIKDGDTVAVILSNVPEYPIVVFGILAAGGIATIFSPLFTSHETRRLLTLSDASLIIVTDDIVPTIKDALELAEKDIPVIILDIDQNGPEGYHSYKELAEDVHPVLRVLNEVKRGHNDVALMVFSSGTTGLPKAVQVTDRNMIANCQQMNTGCRQYAYTTDTHQDSVLVVLPLFHMYMCIMMIHKMSVGLKLVILPKFNVETFLNTLLNNKIQVLYLVPQLVTFLGSYPDVTSKHLEDLTCVNSSAVFLPQREIKNFLMKSQSTTYFGQCYGLSETMVVTMTPMGRTFLEGVGYPLPNVELRIVDSQMRNLGPGEVGELLIRGPNVMKGYLNNPEANREAFVDGDWIRSGDVGKIDETGLFSISDRLKEIIKVKGFQVSPAELEGVLKEHPSVIDAAVIGVTDPRTGEKPIAFVVRKEDSETTEEDIISFVNPRVAPYKRITDVLWLHVIPKNYSGKILKRELRDKYYHSFLIE